MGMYNIYLANKVAAGEMTDFWGEGVRYSIGVHLMDLFDQVCAHASSPYGKSDYWWDKPAGDVGSKNLLVYFVQNQSKSIVKQANSAVNVGGFAGYTQPTDDGVISEVYLETVVSQFAGGGDLTRGVAVLAFHECMHNKLKMAHRTLHTQGGGGLAKDVLNNASQLSAKNIELMAKALDKPVQQNTGFL